MQIASDLVLPELWRAEPPGEETQTFGSLWIERNKAAVLRVPSILAPGEHNLLLNPAHAQFKRLKISAPQPFDFDDRLWKREYAEGKRT
jgi:RES domain-containing protein